MTSKNKCSRRHNYSLLYDEYKSLYIVGRSNDIVNAFDFNETIYYRCLYFSICKSFSSFLMVDRRNVD